MARWGSSRVVPPSQTSGSAVKTRLMHEHGLRSTGGIDLTKFVVNPKSFKQTTENLFYVSFLIRDGRVEIDFDEDGLPALAPVDREGDAAGAIRQSTCTSGPEAERRRLLEEEYSGGLDDLATKYGGDIDRFPIQRNFAENRNWTTSPNGGSTNVTRRSAPAPQEDFPAEEPWDFDDEDDEAFAQLLSQDPKNKNLRDTVLLKEPSLTPRPSSPTPSFCYAIQFSSHSARS